MSNAQVIAAHVMETLAVAVRATGDLVKGRPLDINEVILETLVVGTEPADVPAHLREQILLLLPEQGKDCSPALIGRKDAENIEDYCRRTGRRAPGDVDPGKRLEFGQELYIPLKHAGFAAVVKYAAVGRLRIHGGVPMRDLQANVTGTTNTVSTNRDKNASTASGKMELTLSGRAKLGGSYEDSRENRSELIAGSSVSEEVARAARDSKGFLTLSINLHLDCTILETTIVQHSQSMDCVIGASLGEVRFHTIE